MKSKMHQSTNEIQDISGQTENARMFIKNVSKAMQYIQKEKDTDANKALQHMRMLNTEISNFLKAVHDLPSGVGVSKHLIGDLQQLQGTSHDLLMQMVQRTNQ